MGIIFKKQPDMISCGPTSLSMCYTYYKKEYSISRLKKLCHTNTNGTSPQDLINAAQKVNSSYRLFEEEYRGFEQIKKHVDNDNPMIIQLQTIPELGYRGSYGHYVALTGYNEKFMAYKIGDPSRGMVWFSEPVIKKAVKKRLELGIIKPVKVLKKV